MIMQILRIMRISAGFGGIWVASGGHFGRLTWPILFVQPTEPLDQASGTGTNPSVTIISLGGGF
jgi:hypothetical protein